MQLAPIRYAKAFDGDSIAYQVVGNGAMDIVYVPGFVSHIDAFWDVPEIAAFYNRLASFSRLILFDKRGTGLSDPLPGPQPLEERFLDVGAVMDAAGSQRAALVGLSEGCAMATVFAATYPERTSSLVLCGTIIGGSAPDHPAGAKWLDAAERFRAGIREWGSGKALRLVAPTSTSRDDELGSLERTAGSPRMARDLMEMWLEIDLRTVLPAVSVPTLVLHRKDEIFPVEAARDIVERMPNARLVELDGVDHVPWNGNVDRYVGEIEEFLTGVRERSTISRRLATLVITDIVASTTIAAERGDRESNRILARHDDIIRMSARRFDGEHVNHTGDGSILSFDGPARAIRCAREIVERVREQLGIEIRVGIHTGEVEKVGNEFRGLAIHVATRVTELARPGEILVSSTVKELVLGSGMIFADRGNHELKGVPDTWRIYAVAEVPR